LGGNPIQFNFTIPAVIISFLLLVWLLSAKAWGPLMKIMEERRSHIEAMLAQAENERQQAEKIKGEYQAEMHKARQEAQEVIAKATKVSEACAKEILAASHEESERIKKSALMDIERERDLAISEVRAQVADLSVLVAEKIIRQKLDLQGQGELIEQFIQEVGEMQ